MTDIGDGVALTSAEHPRQAWWKTALFWMIHRDISPDSLIAEDVELTDAETEAGMNDNLAHDIAQAIWHSEFNRARMTSKEPPLSVLYFSDAIVSYLLAGGMTADQIRSLFIKG